MQHSTTFTTAMLQDVCDGFNRHDLDAIMAFFAEDAVMEMPRGPQPWGQRYEGTAAVREALAGRFAGLPDVHYGDDSHWVSADGQHGVSEWTLTGTQQDGRKVRVRGCDHWTFRGDKIVKKDSYWKIVDQ